MDRKISDIRLLAAPLNCVAGVWDPVVADFAARIGAWMPDLMTCATRDAMDEAVSDRRPDIAIVGPTSEAGDFDRLAQHLRTATIGVVVLHEAQSPPAQPLDILGARMEVEPVDTSLDMAEIVLRLRALVRRCRPLALTQRHNVGTLTLDEAALTIAADGASMPLSLEGFRLVGPFFDMPDRIWPREDLLALAYGAATTNGLRTVDVKLNWTRRKMRATLGCDPILTVRGVGYALG